MRDEECGCEELDERREDVEDVDDVVFIGGALALRREGQGDGAWVVGAGLEICGWETVFLGCGGDAEGADCWRDVLVLVHGRSGGGVKEGTLLRRTIHGWSKVFWKIEREDSYRRD